ncbi:hypothetical protein BGM19_15225 [Streptomyces agglomeratus]|nr:hypothetical protein BGM19_15225 [Streptomyces agglomeratus]
MEEGAGYAGPLSAAPGKRPSCGDPASSDFPITTRLRGGPDTYRAGGAAGEWSLELTNTTAHSCRNIHPVIVLTDRARELASDQVELEFDDGSGRWIDVRFHTTDEDEHIGVFDGGFPGFTVAAHSTVTVEVRLAFASGTAPAHAVVNAALVQRRSDDGEWVGESNDYRFTVAGRDPGHDTGHDPDDPDPPEADPDPDPDPNPNPDRDPDPDRSPGPDRDPGTGDDDTPDGREHPPALAMTSRDPGPLLALGTTAGALILGGAALMAGARRHLRGSAGSAGCVSAGPGECGPAGRVSGRVRTGRARVGKALGERRAAEGRRNR